MPWSSGENSRTYALIILPSYLPGIYTAVKRRLLSFLLWHLGWGQNDPLLQLLEIPEGSCTTEGGTIPEMGQPCPKLQIPGALGKLDHAVILYED